MSRLETQRRALANHIAMERRRKLSVALRAMIHERRREHQEVEAQPVLDHFRNAIDRL